MENLEIAKSKIEKGAKFNGVVYNKFNGKHWVTFSVYLDGVYFKICEVQKADMSSIKAEIENTLLGLKRETKNTYAENYFSHGLDYAEEGNKTGL